MPELAAVLKNNPQLSTWSQQARDRLVLPPRRGTFRPIDAARRELGLLSVDDGTGNMRLYWLIDLSSKTVVEARFLAYGNLETHPLADAYSEAVVGQTVTEIAQQDPELVEARLRDQSDIPAFGRSIDLSFLKAISLRAEAVLPEVRLLPKPVEKERYQRKREQEWDDQDREWLPLSLMKKLVRAQQEGDLVLRERTGREIAWSVEGLHDDFRILARFPDLDRQEVPLVLGFLASGLQGRIHPHISIEEAPQ